MTHARARQSGATLLVTLIMLIMLTLFAISAMNTSLMNLRMAGNMQARTEAFDATQRAIETAISTTRFIDFPSDVIQPPCSGLNTVCTDLNGDGNPELITTLTPAPACVQAKITKVSELSITGPNSEDVACLQAQQQGTFGVTGASTAGDSLCGQTTWNITAQTTTYGTTTAQSDVNYTATQGIGVRVKAIDIAASCP
jgi:hypothetical protein